MVVISGVPIFRIFKVITNYFVPCKVYNDAVGIKRLAKAHVLSPCRGGQTKV